jgi:hypothetical protein
MSRLARGGAVALVAVGILQGGGRIAGLSTVARVGEASGASPAGAILATERGYEACSTRILLEWRGLAGAVHRAELTADTFGKLRGPCARRRFYAGAFASAPILYSESETRPMVDAALQAGLCGEAPLLRALGFDPFLVGGPLRVSFEPSVAPLPYDLPGTIRVYCP